LYIGGGGELAYLLRDFKLQPRELTILLTDTTASGVAPSGFSDSIAGTAHDLVRQDLDGLSGVILADEYDFDDEQIAVLMQARARGAQIHVLTAFYEEYLAKVPVQHLKYGWFVYGSGFYLLHGTFSMKAKRLVDFVLAAFLLVVLSPLMLLVALAVKLDSRGPVFYVQQRTGLNSQVFNMIKFRSMVADAESQGVQWAGENDPRITRVGRFLRKSRFDELPQLWNVLVGDMSFIGPRPERPEFIAELEKQIPFYELRHLVKPGISGWAQVMYPYGASVEDALHKLQYDLFYIKNYSIFLDLIITIKTLRLMIWHQGR
jgi:exopolysaccharide biosynthesis polyprenyl glycosylphosphotransferase